MYTDFIIEITNFVFNLVLDRSHASPHVYKYFISCFSTKNDLIDFLRKINFFKKIGAKIL